MEMMETLESAFGYNEPILLNEINIPGISAVYIRQMLTRLVKRGLLERYGQGVYYIPTTTVLGKSRLSAKKVYEKKYISDGKSVYGFYAGLSLENTIGITTQVPNIIEIVTNKESSRLREIIIGKQRIRLRKSIIEITNQNIKTLEFLDLMSRINLGEMSQENKDKLRKYLRQQQLKQTEVFKYISKYSSRTSKNIIESGAINDLT